MTRPKAITIPLSDSSSLEMVYVEGDMRHRSLYFGKHPVTNEQFVPFLNEKGNQEEEGTTWVNLQGSYKAVRCGIKENENGFSCVKGLEQHPMVYVNWYGASAYCSWLKEKTGDDYRLPPEAVWEFAAKGGKYSKGFTYAGSNKLKEVGWYDENSHGETKLVGLKLPNELGLYDMSGNVREWCADEDNVFRVVRGGSWYYNDVGCRVSYRDWSDTLSGDYDVGFRVARF